MVIKSQRQAAFFIWLICAALLSFIVTGFHCILPWLFDIAVYASAAILLPLAIYLHFLIKNTYCTIDGSFIRSYTGVFFHHTVCVSTSKVLYYTVCRTPLSRISGLNFIILNTFGGKTFLMFLSDKNCKLITELL